MIEVPHFWGWEPNGAYDPEILTRMRFLYNAPMHQVSSSICLIIQKLLCWQTHKQTNIHVALLCYAG